MGVVFLEVFGSSDSSEGSDSSIFLWGFFFFGVSFETFVAGGGVVTTGGGKGSKELII